jgi:hypothetical protein
VGGFISLLLGLMYPVTSDFGPFIFLFLSTVKILLILGGSLVILGAILYSNNIFVSGIIILIGAPLGLNPISTWGGIIVVLDFYNRKKFQKKEERRVTVLTSEHVLLRCLNENKGKAFSALALYNRCLEDEEYGFSLRDTEKSLQDLYVLGRIHLDTRNNTNYYYVS